MRKNLLFLTLLNISSAYADNTSASNGAKIINNCWQKDGDHVSKVDCEVKTLNNLKEQLESLYTQQLTNARAQDKSFKNAGAETYAILEKDLTESQAAFISYKDSECARQAGIYGAGTFAADTTVGCEIDLIIARLGALEKTNY